MISRKSTKEKILVQLHDGQWALPPFCENEKLSELCRLNSVLFLVSVYILWLWKNLLFLLYLLTGTCLCIPLVDQQVFSLNSDIALSILWYPNINIASFT